MCAVQYKGVAIQSLHPECVYLFFRSFGNFCNGRTIVTDQQMDKDFLRADVCCGLIFVDKATIREELDNGQWTSSTIHYVYIAQRSTTTK